MVNVLVALATIKYLGWFAVFLLRKGFVKFTWDLPGQPTLWAEIEKAFEDKHITTAEINRVLDALKDELPFWGDAVINILQTVLSFVKPIDWDLTGKWEKYWNKIVLAVADDKLTNYEVGDILASVMGWVDDVK